MLGYPRCTRLKSYLFPYFVEIKPAEPAPVEVSTTGDNDDDPVSTDNGREKDDDPKLNVQPWSERSEVRLIDRWGRTGNKGVFFTRPLQPSANDWINLSIAADVRGYFYVFRLFPRDSLIYQASSFGMPQDQCEPLLYEHAHEERFFGTYKLDDPPGQYAFLILLANRPLEIVCVDIPRLWATTNRNDDLRERFFDAIGRSQSNSDILGYEVFNYEVFDE